MEFTGEILIVTPSFHFSMQAHELRNHLNEFSGNSSLEKFYIVKCKGNIHQSWPAALSKIVIVILKFDILALDEAARAFRFRRLHLVLVVFATLCVVAEAHIGSRVVLGASMRRRTRAH